MTVLDAMKRGAAAVTDHLAAIGERLPALSSFTVSAGGVTITATPKPPEQPKACPTCGAPKP